MSYGSRYGSNRLTGPVRIDFTADGNDEDALELVVDAAGFGDVKALDVVYVTGGIIAGEDEAINLINIDESGSSGGDVHAVEVLATEGSAAVYGLIASAGVNPVKQLSGSFGDMDSALVNATNRLSEFISTGSNIVMFVADNDTVTIGDANKFEEIEFLLATTASGAGIRPTFEFSDGAAGWIEFSPIDGTNGMRNTGVIVWDDTDIGAWAQESGKYLIRITRTQNGLGRKPVESLVQIAAVTVYAWDSDGDVSIKDLAMAGALDHNGSTAGFYSTTPTAQQTGVGVNAAEIHAALVTLGLITA